VAEFLKTGRARNPEDKAWKDWDLTGFAGARSVSYRLEFEKPLFHERVALDMDKAEGLFALLKETKPVDARKLAADAPADVLAFMGGRLPADKVLATFFKAAEAGEPKAGDNRRKQILALKEQGFDLEALLAKSLTGEIAVWAAMPAAGGLFPEVVISARMTDSGPVEQMIQFIAAAQQAKLKAAQPPDAAKPDEPAPAKFKLEPTDYKGSKLFVFPAQPGNPVVLSALVLPDRVIFASNPLAAKRAATPPAAGGLSEKAEFKEKLAKLPPNAVGVQYLDVPRIFNLVYGTGTQFLLAAKGGERIKERFGLDLAQLPPAELVSKHLVPEVGCFYADEKGLRLEARSNAPRAALVAAFAAIIAGAKAQAKADLPLPGRPAEPPA